MLNKRAAILLTFLTLFAAGCKSATEVTDARGNAKPGPRENSANAPTTPTTTPVTTQPQVANGDYPGKGKITKIDIKNGSVEMEHDEIVGVMPAMLMEFYVTDASMLKGLAVGDNVDFTLRYKDRSETIVGISKAK